MALGSRIKQRTFVRSTVEKKDASVAFKIPPLAAYQTETPSDEECFLPKRQRQAVC